MEKTRGTYARPGAPCRGRAAADSRCPPPVSPATQITWLWLHVMWTHKYECEHNVDLAYCHTSITNTLLIFLSWKATPIRNFNKSPFSFPLLQCSFSPVKSQIHFRAQEAKPLPPPLQTRVRQWQRMNCPSSKRIKSSSVRHVPTPDPNPPSFQPEKRIKIECTTALNHEYECHKRSKRTTWPVPSFPSLKHRRLGQQEV